MFVPGVNVPRLPPVRPAGVHVPPAAGEPPKELNRFTAAPLLQSVIAPFVPAFAAVFTVTATVAVAFAHGATPVTVYVNVPATLVPGVNVPRLPPVSPADHVPPACGEPPSELNRFTGEPLLQSVIDPFVPAFAAVFTVTATVAVAFAQGAVPVIV